MFDYRSPSNRAEALKKLVSLGGWLLLGLITVLLARAAYGRRAEVRELMRRLDDPSASERASAAHQLGKKRVKEAVPQLERCLTDRDSKVRGRAAKALWRIHRYHGEVQDYKWHVLRVSDRISVLPGGEVALTRRVQFQISLTYSPVEEVSLPLPAADLRVRYVTDGDGRSLPFGVDRDYPQPEVEVSRITKATSGSIREALVDSDLTGLIRQEPGRADRARLVYRPGFFNVPVWEYRLLVQLPEGVDWQGQPQAGTWARKDDSDGKPWQLRWKAKGLTRERQRTLRFEVVLPREATPELVPSAPADRPARELVVALCVILFLSALAAGYLFLARRAFRKWFHVHVLAVASLIGLAVLFQPALIEDNLAYYCYARSPVLDGDFNFYDDFLLLNSNRLYFYEVQEKPSPSGPAILWAPFILAGHAVCGILNGLGIRSSSHGFSLPYLFAVGIGGFLFSFTSLLLAYELARKYCSARAALLATLSITFGTNLVLVVFMWTGSSFQPSLFVFTVFLYYWHETREKRSASGWLLLGLIGGLMVQIRYQNGLLLIIPFVEWLRSGSLEIRDRNWKSSRHLCGYGLLFLLGVLLGFSPQLAVFQSMTGQPMEDTYRLTEPGRFVLADLPRNITGMFWSGHARAPASGFFSGTPVLVFAFLGLIPFARRARWVACAIILALALQVAVTATYANWYGKLVFIPSLYLVTCSPIFVLGLAETFDWLRRRPRGLLIGCGVAAIAAVWNLYNCYLQLVYKQVDPFPRQVPPAEGLHKLLFLPADRFRDRFVELSGSFGHFLRGLTHGLSAGQPIELLGTLCQWLLVIPLVALVALLAQKWATRPARNGGSRGAWCLVGVVVAGFLVLDVVVFAIGRATDMDYSHYRRNLVGGPTSPTVLWGEIWATSSPKRSRRLSFTPDRFGPAKSHVHLIGFLRNAESVKQGAVATTVRIEDTEGREYEADLRAGVQVADLACERPESRPKLQHSLEGTRVACDWRLRDGSRYYYWGHAYLCHIQLPEPVVVKSLRVIYRQEVGEYVLTDVRFVEPSKEWPAHMLGTPVMAELRAE